MGKVQKGDIYIVFGKDFLEKSEVLSVEKRMITLHNGVKINSKTGIVLNSKYEAQPYNEKDFQGLEAKFGTTKLLREISEYISKNKENLEVLSRVYKRLKRVIKE